MLLRRLLSPAPAPAPARAAAVAFLLLVPFAASSAQRSEYAPGTARYRVVISGKGNREQMGQQQSTTFESRQSVTVVLARAHRDTLAMSLTIDSISGTSDGMALPDLGGGMTVTAALSPGGELYANSAKARGDSVLSGVDVEDVARFLPPLRSALRAGAKWTDTVARPISQLGMSMQRQVIASYEVLGDTTIGGERAWRIARRTETKVNGEGAAMGQKVTVEATGSGAGTVYVSAGGQFLGSSSTDDVRSTAHIGEGTTVSDSRTMTSRVERLK